MRPKLTHPKKIAILLISMTFFIGIFVCVLVDFILTETLSWSLYPLGAMIMAWLIIVPAIIAAKRKSLFALLGLTVSVMPFLYLVYVLAPYDDWFMSLAVPLCAMTVPALWIVVLFFEFVKVNGLLKLAFALVVAAPLLAGIDTTINGFLHETMSPHLFLMKPVICLAAALILTGLSLFKKTSLKPN